ncbi:MAG: ATP-binding cassette domain-containing protein [Kiritimatiellaeota bacterium]|nr:ATP-binding cassette domain-containing protein [Kiritimatiellota bacterium]
MRWQSFTHHRRGFYALMILAGLYAATIVGGFFLKGGIISDESLKHRRRITVTVRPDNPVVRLDVDGEGRILWGEGDFAYFGIDGSMEGERPREPSWDSHMAFPNPTVVSAFTNGELRRIVLRAPEERPVTVVTRSSLVHRHSNDERRMTSDERLVEEAVARCLDEYVPPIDIEGATVTVVAEPVAWPFRPVPEHPLGIDMWGQDVLVQIVLGLRTSLTFGLLLVISSVVLGILLGAIQGFFAGATDIVGQRLTEIWAAIPFLYVMLLFGNIFGRSFLLLFLCYAAFNWIGIAAYVRAEYLRLRNRPFIDAARTQRLSSMRIMLRHILPNALTPVITLVPFELVGAIGSLAALDYLGFGLPAGTPSLGALLQQAQLARFAWWLILFPSLTLFVVMLLGVFIGEALRDAFDPRAFAAFDGEKSATPLNRPSNDERRMTRDDINGRLSIRGLCVSYESPTGIVEAVRDVSLDIAAGETLGIVGESGCGKSTVAAAILRLIPSPPGRITCGEILFDGKDVLTLPLPELRRIRGKDIAMVFQDPMTSLSPLCRIGDQLIETQRLHDPKISRRAATAHAAEWLEKVGIPDAKNRLRYYPHQFSGGMQQRVMIASALMNHPRLIIADEPTTALDVTLQKQVLELMKGIKGRDASLLLITHNMGIVRTMCDRVAVMLDGAIVEIGATRDCLAAPRHPYTQSLLAAAKRLQG